MRPRATRPRELEPAEVGRIYDDIYTRSPLGDSARFYRRLIARIRPAPGDEVLDIGCGLGGALAALAEAGTRPWGIDVSTVALRGAREHAPRARLVRGDGARLPFPDASFRWVLNLGNLEHFTDWEGGVLEMRRVLAPGGRAWVLLPNLFYSGTIWRVIRGGRGPDHHQPIDRFATRTEWGEILEAGGLRVVRSFPHHRHKWWKRLLPSGLAWHFLFETERGDVAAEPPLPPLERVRPVRGAPRRPPPE